MASKTASLFTYSQNIDENIDQNGLEGICMIEADSHVVWDQFDTEDLKGPAVCSRGRTTIECC